MSDEIERLIRAQAGQTAALGAVCLALVKLSAIEAAPFIAALERSSNEMMAAEGAQPYEQAALNGVIALLRMASGSGGGTPAAGH